MKNKIATTIEQSKKLLELGLSDDTADMNYCNSSYKGENYIGEWELSLQSPQEAKSILDMSVTSWNTYWEIIPAWSLSTLMELLPSELELPDMYGGTIKYEIRIRKYRHANELDLYQIAYATNQGLSKSWHDMVNTSEQEDLLDAVFEMIVYLKENKLI